MDPCSEVMKLFDQAKRDGLTVTFWENNNSRWKPEDYLRKVDRAYCYPETQNGKQWANLSVDVYGIVGCKFTQMYQKNFHLDPERIKVTTIINDGNKELSLDHLGKELFRAQRLPWWKLILQK